MVGDLGVVVDDLRGQLRMWMETDPQGRHEQYQLSPQAAAALRTYMFNRKVVERHLDRYVVEMLGPDISHPDAIERVIVQRAKCPQFDGPISNEIDVRTQMGLREFVRLLASSEEAAHEKKKPLCPYCSDVEHDRDHTPVYSFTRYSANLTRVSWGDVTDFEESLGLYEFEIARRQNRQFSLQVLPGIVPPDLPVDPSYGEFTDQRLVRMRDRIIRSINERYSEISEFVQLAGKPLAAATLRVRTDPLRKIERAVLRGQPAGTLFNVRGVLNCGDDASVEAYVEDLAERFSGDSRVEVVEGPAPFRKSGARGITGRTLVVRYMGVRIANNFFSLPTYVEEQRQSVRISQQNIKEINRLRQQLPTEGIVDAMLDALNSRRTLRERIASSGYSLGFSVQRLFHSLRSRSRTSR